MNENAPKKQLKHTRKARLFTHEGKSQTLKEWAEELGIKPVTLYMRLRNGWPVSKVLGQALDLCKARKKQEYTFNGTTASSSGWAKITGIPEKTLHYRLTHPKAWTIERALTTPYSPHIGVFPKNLTYDGETLTIKGWSQKLGIREQTLRKRMSSGHDIAVVLDPNLHPSCETKKTPISFNGETHCLRDWAKITGISPQTISLRLRSGWTTHDALTIKPKTPHTIRYSLHGAEKTVPEWAKQFGISPSVLRGRLARGWGIEESLETPVGTRGRKRKEVL